MRFYRITCPGRGPPLWPWCRCGHPHGPAARETQQTEKMEGKGRPWLRMGAIWNHRVIGRGGKSTLAQKQKHGRVRTHVSEVLVRLEEGVAHGLPCPLPQPQEHLQVRVQRLGRKLGLERHKTRAGTSGGRMVVKQTVIRLSLWFHTASMYRNIDIWIMIVCMSVLTARVPQCPSMTA